MGSKFRQEMPPEGGYASFNIARTFPKTFWKPGLVLAVNAALSLYGFFYNIRDMPKRAIQMSFEDEDYLSALEPFLMAERDRKVLRTMKKNLALEEEIMKDEPGWKVGTWYGEPVYFTLGDRWIEPLVMENCAHLRKWDWPFNSYWRLDGPWPRQWNTARF